MYGIFSKLPLVLFNKDDGAGDTTDADTSGGSDDNQSPDGGGDDKSRNSGDDNKDKSKQKDEKKFSQADVDEIVKERLARQKKSDEADAEKKNKKAEEDALKEKQEFEKLADKRQARIEELEAENADLTSHKEKAERYEKALKEYASAQMKNLPKHILKLLEKSDPLEQLKYLAENQKELGVSISGIDSTPDEADKTTLTKEQDIQMRRESAKLNHNNY